MSEAIPAEIKTLELISELHGSQERRAGGHNWPDMEIVIDPTQTDIENDALYLLQIQNREAVVKRCLNEGSCIRLHPAVSTIHGVRTERVLGKLMPVTSIEFSDLIYKWHITIHGKVLGIWNGPPAALASEDARNDA